MGEILIIVILVIGMFFRFANLEKKFYWIDEGYTSMRISGYTDSEFIQELGDGKIKQIKSLQNSQHINAEKSVFDTVKKIGIRTISTYSPVLCSSEMLSATVWRFNRSN